MQLERSIEVLSKNQEWPRDRQLVCWCGHHRPPGGHRFDIRNQSLRPLVVPVPPGCDGHEAARWWAESDGYLCRNISPFSWLASVHFKSLTRHTSPLSPRPARRSRTSQTNMWRHFFHLCCCSQLQNCWTVTKYWTLSPFSYNKIIAIWNNQQDFSEKVQVNVRSSNHLQ